MYVNIPVIYGFYQMKVYEDSSGITKRETHVFAGKIKVDVNVAGDLGVDFSLENSALRVGVIFHDLCEAGCGWDGNGNLGNTR